MSGVFHPSFREIQRVWQRTREEVGAARERVGREGRAGREGRQGRQGKKGDIFSSSESIAYIDTTVTNASSV